MFRTVRSRAIAVLGLLGLLFGLAAWYGMVASTPAPALGIYPTEGHLAAGYERYLGTRAVVSGTVVAVDPVVLRAGYGAGDPLRLTVTGLEDPVAEGTLLTAYGVVEPERTIRALTAISVPRSGQWYAWGVSLLAGLWVLARLGRHWRLDWGDWTLRPRTTPRRTLVVARLRTILHRLRNR